MQPPVARDSCIFRAPRPSRDVISGQGRNVGAILALVLASLSPDASAQSWTTEPEPIDTTGHIVEEIRPDVDGYIYDDPRFEAHIAPDGRVTFKTRLFALSVFAVVASGARPQGLPLASFRDLSGKVKHRSSEPEPEAALPSRRIVWSEACSPDTCDPPRFAWSTRWNGVGFSIALPERRRAGRLPSALEKGRFLSATFELRLKMAMAARAADMKAALDGLPAYLEQVFGDDRRSLHDRRHTLFDLWYETDVTPEGERAAQIIVDFIRRRLPCGSPQGFTGEELASFGKLYPDRRFSPCGPEIHGHGPRGLAGAEAPHSTEARPTDNFEARPADNFATLRMRFP
jgi:hypothetical protein